MPAQALKEAILAKNHAAFEKILGDIKAGKYPHFDIDSLLAEGRSLLGIAIHFEDPLFTKMLIGMGANVNAACSGTIIRFGTYSRAFVVTNRVTPIRAILDRIYPRKEDIVGRSYGIGIKRSLIEILAQIINGNDKEGGADLKEIYHIFKYSHPITYSALAWLAVSLKIEEIEDKIVRSDVLKNWKKILECKIYAHRYGLVGEECIEGHRFSLEAFTLGMTSFELVNSYNKFRKNAENQRKLHKVMMSIDIHPNREFHCPFLELDMAQMEAQVTKDFCAIASPHSLRDVRESMLWDQIIAIPVSVNIGEPGDHGIGYVLYNDLCLRVNCGAGSRKYSTGFSGFTIYRIHNRESFLDTELPLLINNVVNPIDDDYLLTKFIINGNLENIFSIPWVTQLVGNCTFFNTQLLLFAVIFLNVYKSVRRIYPEPELEIRCFEFARKKASAWFSLYYLYDRSLGHRLSLENESKEKSEYIQQKNKSMKKVAIQTLVLFAYNIKNICNSDLKNKKEGLTVLKQKRHTQQIKQIHMDAMLIKAVRQNDLKLIEWLLEQGANINIQNEKGETPIMIAANDINLLLVEWLIKKNADLLITDNEGDTILFWTIALEWEGVQDQILKRCKAQHLCEQLLHKAIQFEDEKTINSLLRFSQLDLNVRMKLEGEKYRYSFLERIIHKKDFGLLKFILNEYAHLLDLDPEGPNALALTNQYVSQILKEKREAKKLRSVEVLGKNIENPLPYYHMKGKRDLASNGVKSKKSIAIVLPLNIADMYLF